MSLVWYDRIKESTTTAGTGTLALGGAVADFRAFSTVGDGNTCYYTIDDGASSWEVGLGTYASGANTLARSVLFSSNANALVNFGAGSKNVWLDLPASIFGNVVGAATSVVNDTNVTGSLSGNVLTLGWTGTLAPSRVATLNQNTTGSAATLTTPRGIYGNNFDGSAALTQIIAATYGGTNNAFTQFSGPSASIKTFTLPNASANILTDNAAVIVAQGGTGDASFTAYSVLCGGMTSTGALQNVSGLGSSGNVLTSNGAGTLPTWQAAPSTAPGGSDLSIQFNSDSAFGGAATVSWDDVANVLNVSTNATASNPPLELTGTWFSGGSATTTKPHFMVEGNGATSTGWNTNGTGLGVNAINAFTGNLLDLQMNGLSQVKVDSNGKITGITGAWTGLHSWVMTGKALDIQALTTNTSFVKIYNGTAQLFYGVESSAGGAIYTGTAAYSSVFGSNNAGSVHLVTNGSVRQTIDSSGNLQFSGKMTNYNNIATAGIGVPAVYAAGRATAQTAANASVSTYTLPASDGTYRVSANVLVTTSNAEAFTVTVSYTDEGNTARVLTLNFSILAGTLSTSIAAANGAVPYEGVPLHIRCKASTSITIKSAAGGVYTGATYNIEGIIEQLA